MVLCAFCPRFASPGGKWAVTAQALDGSWRREILPRCPRCNRLLREAGREGRLLKAMGERWFGGRLPTALDLGDASSPAVSSSL